MYKVIYSRLSDKGERLSSCGAVTTDIAQAAKLIDDFHKLAREVQMLEPQMYQVELVEA